MQGRLTWLAQGRGISVMRGCFLSFSGKLAAGSFPTNWGKLTPERLQA